MVRYFFLWTIILLFGCSSDDNAQQNESLEGDWTLVETLNSNGGTSPAWVDVTDGYEYSFKSDGSFSSSRFDECKTGNYDVIQNILNLKYSCNGFSTGVEQPDGTFVEEISFEDGFLILKPTYLTCIEGCGFKFRKN